MRKFLVVLVFAGACAAWGNAVAVAAPVSPSVEPGQAHTARGRRHTYAEQLAAETGVRPAATGVNLYGPFVDYSFPGSGYSDLSQTLTVLDAPAGGHYFWSHDFSLVGDTGYIGLQVGSYPNNTRAALFTIFNSTAAEASAVVGSHCEHFTLDAGEGAPGYSCWIDPFDFVVGRTYAMTVTRDLVTPDGTWWVGRLRDTITGVVSEIGRIRVPPDWGGIVSSGSWTEKFGDNYPSCDAVVPASARFDHPTEQGGTVQVTAVDPKFGQRTALPSCGAGPNGGTTIASDPGGEVMSYRPRTPPSNDAFSLASQLTGASGSTTGSNAGASVQAGEPENLAADHSEFSVWWSWTAPSAGTLAVNLAGSSFDTTLAVYAGSALGSLTKLASDDDSGGSKTSRVTGIPVTAGTTYRIAVDGYAEESSTSADYLASYFDHPASGAIHLAWSLDGTGLLRVVTSPSVPSQITVDGTIADTWGLQWVKEPSGPHTVCFSSVAGYTTPACQTVTVAVGATTTVTGTFIQRGYLHVTTSPAVPSEVIVDGYPMDDWGLYTDLPAGTHLVCFGAVAGFTPAPCKSVVVSAGSTTNLTGTFTASAGTKQAGVGLLRVTTSPAVPSQITVDGNPADTWGLTWLEIPGSAHTVCFTRVQGYSTPACQTVTVVDGSTTTVVGVFTQRGYLKVDTNPAVAGTITINGVPADDWGVYTDVPAGPYTVCFGAVAGKTAPACQNPTVTAGTTTTITGTYT